jgi:hypothetical protein
VLVKFSAVNPDGDSHKIVAVRSEAVWAAVPARDHIMLLTFISSEDVGTEFEISSDNASMFCAMRALNEDQGNVLTVRGEMSDAIMALGLVPFEAYTSPTRRVLMGLNPSVIWSAATMVSETGEVTGTNLLLSRRMTGSESTKISVSASLDDVLRCMSSAPPIDLTSPLLLRATGSVQ